MEGPASVGGPPTAGIDLAIEESANELASMVESILFDFHERDLQFMGDTNDQLPTTSTASLAASRRRERSR